MANEIDLTRASPSQISQMVQHREMRNNSQLAMTKNSHIANVAVAGNHSVLGHSNQSPMGGPSNNNSLGVTKRHNQEANSSNKQ